MEAARSHSHIATVVALALALLFLASAIPELDTQQRNFDEGVYILQAKLVREGALPYTDFFYQQTPLYLYALAGFSSLAPESLFAHRLLSLLAVSATGIVLVHAALRFAPLPAAAATALFFYFSPIQRFGFLALPNGLMVALTVLGVYGTVFQQQTRWVVSGALCLVAAVLVKPLALPTLLAVGTFVLLVPEQRWKLKPLMLTTVTVGLSMWALLHVATDGSFTDVVVLQAFRYAGDDGFEFMAHVPEFREALLQRGVSTALGWNLSEHAHAFLALPLIFMNLGLVLLALLGGIALLCAKRAHTARLALGLALWAGLPFLFSVFVWGPVWDHYFVQYLPPLSLLAAAAMGALWQHRRLTLSSRALAVALVAAYALSGFSLPTSDPLFYERAAQLPRDRGPLLTFDPLLNFLSGTQPGCDLLDPLNVYGDYSLSAISPDGPLARFNVSARALSDCLRSSQEVTVVVSPMLSWFLDERLAGALRELDSNRVVYLTPADQALLEPRTPVAPASPIP